VVAPLSHAATPQAYTFTYVQKVFYQLFSVLDEQKSAHIFFHPQSEYGVLK
jgi:hypothetical protein